MLDRLPYEIFKEIIQTSNPFVSPHRRPDKDPIPYELVGISLPPIKASHVCRSWRMALLNDPAMWTCLRIPQMRPDAVKEMLRRSGTSRLNVFIEPLPHSPCLTVQEINMLAAVFRSEVHRLRGLQITDIIDGPGRQWVFVVLPYLKQPAPELQKFYLKVSQEAVPLNGDFLRALFSGNTPCLSHVFQRLSGSQTLTCCPLFQNLSSLYFEVTGSITIHCDTLLDILQLSPQLYTFGLKFSYPTLPIVPPASSHVVRLPCLRQLSLWGYSNADVINYVLNHLVFPLENLEYHIQCNKSYSSPSALLLQLLTQRRPTFLSISCSRVENAFLDFFPSYSSHPGIIPIFRTLYNESMDNLPTFLQIFSLSDITHLRIEAGPVAPTVLRDIFFSLVNLQHLRLVHKHQSDPASVAWSPFLLALMPIPSTALVQGLEERLHDDSQRDNSQACVTPSPSLRTLELIVSPIMELDEPDAEMVYACSEMRRCEGHPFKHVTIYCKEWYYLSEDAASWLQPREGFPIEVLTDFTMDDTDFL